MRATCPSCEAVYEIPDHLVGAGRRLRCANCGHEWTVLPAAEAPAAPAAPEPPAGPPFPVTPPPPAPPYAPAPRAEPPAYPLLRRAPQLIDPPLPPMDDATIDWRGATALRVAWIGSVLLVALVLAAFWTFRYEIATAWPPAARLTGAPVGGG